MDISAFGAMGDALGQLFSASVLFYLFLGTVLGLGLSVIPGIGGMLGLALLLPFTFSMSSFEAMAFLLGALAVLSTSDTIPAILFGVPGTPTSMATVLDGYPMSQRGESGRALAAGLTSSMVGGVLGAIPLLVLIPVMMPVMMGLQSPELLAMCVLGLAMVATLSGGSMSKGLAAACVGILLSMIGQDAQTGTMRWTFGQLYLWEGLNILVVVLGIYAIPELMDMAIKGKSIATYDPKAVRRNPLAGAMQGIRDVLGNMKIVGRSSVISSALGIVPAIGPAVIPWLVYSYTTSTTKGEQQFGNGDVRGVIAVESSNNASVGGALLPTVALGIPGSAPMALLLAGFMLHGIAPGPQMFAENLNMTYMMVWALVLANIVGGAIAFALCVPLSRVVFVRTTILVPIICAVVFVGVVQASRDWLDIVALLMIGVLGWVMKRAAWPRAPLALAFILAPLVEQYFTISYRIHGWGWLSRPAVVVMLVLTAVFLLFVIRKQIGKMLKRVKRQPKVVFLPNLRIEALLAIAAIALSVAAYVTSVGWPRMAAQVPQMTAIALLVFGIGALLAAWIKVTQVDGQPDEKEIFYDVTTDFGELSRPAILMRGVKYTVMLSLFLPMAWAVGVIAAIPAFVLMFMLVGGEKLRVAVPVTAAMAVFAYVVFERLLSLAWPVGYMNLTRMLM